MYLVFKHLHLSCVVLSLLGFILRGGWMLQGSALLGHRAVRVLPHVVDSLLLASAGALMVLGGIYPWSQAWLAAKVAGLVVYIFLGMVALGAGRSRGVRLAAWLGALGVFGYIASVAVTKSPAGFLLWGGVVA